MNLRLAAMLMGSAMLLALPPAHAKSELSNNLAVPIASVVDSASTLASEGASAAVALPAALSEAGASLVVLAVTEGAKGSVYLLERASDGARVSIEIGSEIAGSVALTVGTTIETSAVAAGTLLSVAGEVIALIPTEVGRALMDHEQLSD
jgi:hypothetical protein